MRVIKYQQGSEEKLAILVRVMNDPTHSLHGHALINVPVHAPDRKRDAAWIDLSTVRVIWIRDFLESNDEEEADRRGAG